ncbi:MAG: hypothetical protein GY874_04435 [Desulfobacteraceae bacterium]|nr:hypothetical protein [Desulfobacteraceae bacterium]
MRKFIYGMPVKTFSFIMIAWLFLVIMNCKLKWLYGLDTPYWFPISIFTGISFHFHGLFYLIAFLFVLRVVFRFIPKLNVYQVWFIGISLIVLGNLGQGGWTSAFHNPFLNSDIQYYYDAIKIDSWPDWLTAFNSNQHKLLTHTRTHPPFAIFIHYILLQVSKDNITFLAVAFTLVSSLSIILVWNIFKTLELPLEKRNLLSIIFSVIPAVNIYCAVCLDGIILTSMTLFLFGVVLILKSEKLSFLAIISILLGFTITNLLTYGGVFLIAVASINALREFIIYRRFNIAVSLTISIVVFILLTYIMTTVNGYNHVEGFFTASALENPNGFRLFHWPMRYLATRIENICEILLFLSIGFLALLFHPKRLGFSWLNWQDTPIGVMLSGLITLLAMFLSGAFHTGETARSALFIYPYIMLALTNASSNVLKDILILAGLQTFGMQLLGGYFW